MSNKTSKITISFLHKLFQIGWKYVENSVDYTQGKMKVQPKSKSRRIVEILIPRDSTEEDELIMSILSIEDNYNAKSITFE